MVNEVGERGHKDRETVTQRSDLCHGSSFKEGNVIFSPREWMKRTRLSGKMDDCF